MHDVTLKFLEQVRDETVKTRVGLRDALKREMHPIEKRKISRALDHLAKSIDLMTEVVTLNRSVRSSQSEDYS